MNSVIKETSAELEKINNQRKKWIIASFIVLGGLISLLIAWDWLDRLNSALVWWTIIVCMLTISINWWYWTMRVIHQLITHQRLEFHLLHDIIEDIRIIKEHIKGN